jgi:hypothetical protein
MFVLFFAGVMVAAHYEAAGNPNFTALGVDPADSNMEGKEVRFGVFNSALFATITTDASCGAVNSMHDSFSPLGGLVPLLNIQLGEVVFGGVGAGLYGMLIHVIIGVFIAGLMVGRRRNTWERSDERREDGFVRYPDSRLLYSRFLSLGQREQDGRTGCDRRADGWNEQQRTAWLQRNSIRLQLMHRQQRQRLCGADGECALV